MKKSLVAALCLGIFVLGGCATIKYDASASSHGVEMTSQGQKKYEVVKSFKLDDKGGWIIGLIPANKPGGDNHTYFSTMIDQVVTEAGGDAAINVQIRAQQQFVDILTHVVTFGLYQTRTVTVTGDIIRYVE